MRLSYTDCDGNGSITASTEILEENNYYPFGLKHLGYNQIASSCRNEAAEQYKLNGKEYEDSFGLNIYEMDLRQYDPAMGRWVVQDPVVHHEFSPYSAFDNNPVYWSDPSGADSELDHLGRNRFDANGIYIPPMDRVGENDELAYFYSVEFDGNGGGGDGKKDNRTKSQKEADTRAYLQELLKVNKTVLDVRLLMTPLEDLKALYLSLKALAKNGTKSISELYSKVEIYLTKNLAAKQNPSLINVPNDYNLVHYKYIAPYSSAGWKHLNLKDRNHSFTKIVDNYMFMANKFTIRGVDDVYRSLYQLEGSLKGEAGIFEWIIETGGNVTHRVFIPGGKITGSPNKFIRK